MFQFSRREVQNLKSQIVISSSWGGRRTAPYAFTEQGVAMLSSVLRSERAVAVNIEIDVAPGMTSVAPAILPAMRRRDRQRHTTVFDAIRSLITPPPAPKKKVGYLVASA
jgi:hypothetical protein